MKAVLFATMLALAACSNSTTSGTATPTPAPDATPSASATATPVPSVGCDLEQSLVSAASTAIAAPTALNCTNPAAVSATLTSALGKINLCASLAASKQTLTETKKRYAAVQNEKAILGNVVCPLAVNELGAVLTDKAIPAAWGCSTGATLTAAEALVTTECEKLITY